MLGFHTFAGPWVISVADCLVNEINQGPCYVNYVANLKSCQFLCYGKQVLFSKTKGQYSIWKKILDLQNCFSLLICLMFLNHLLQSADCFLKLSQWIFAEHKNLHFFLPCSPLFFLSQLFCGDLETRNWFWIYEYLAILLAVVEKN